MNTGKDITREDIFISTVPAMFNRSCIKFGDRPCQLYQPDFSQPTQIASNSYSEVYLLVRDLACGLMDMGLKPQDRAAIMAYNCPQWLWSDFAILSCGAVTVTIYPTFSAAEMQYIINDSGSRVVFVREQEGINKLLAHMDNLPTLEKVILMDPHTSCPDNEKFVYLEAVIERGKRYLFTHPYAYQKACKAINEWDMATIVYTSGTTGNPKGAVHTHESIMNACAADSIRFVENGLMIEENDISLSFLPLSHTYERQCGQMMTVTTGGAVAYCESPATLIRDVQIFNPSWFCAVPRIFERIYMAMRDMAAATPESKAAFEKAMAIGLKVVDYRTDEEGFIDMGIDTDFFADLPAELRAEYEWADANVFSRVRALLGKNYRAATSASAGLPAQLCKLFIAMGVRIFEGYGLTESMNAINFSHMRAILPGSMGPATPFNQLKLGEDGEILARGGNLFQGYYNNPEATAEAFDDDGYFHTGDIGMVVHNSKFNVDYYKVIDRKKSIMVLDTGKKVPRAKVESRFTTAHYVEQVCAVGDDRRFVSAVVVPKFDYIAAVLKGQGIEFDEAQMVKVNGLTVKVGDDFITHPEVQKLVATDIAEANSALEEYETIKKYCLSNRVFMPDLDEVTPTLKSKFRNIIKNFAEKIEELYQ
ncbi:MAG: AMP-dependent synthetase/ligase [Methylocystaceae bacterium]